MEGQGLRVKLDIASAPSELEGACGTGGTVDTTEYLTESRLLLHLTGILHYGHHPVGPLHSGLSHGTPDLHNQSGLRRLLGFRWLTPCCPAPRWWELLRQSSTQRWKEQAKEPKFPAAQNPPHSWLLLWITPRSASSGLKPSVQKRNEGRQGLLFLFPQITLNKNSSQILLFPSFPPISLTAFYTLHV